MDRNVVWMFRDNINGRRDSFIMLLSHDGSFVMINECIGNVKVAEHVRGINPCRDTLESLSEAIMVSECCRLEMRFDLAIEVLSFVEAFPLGRQEPIKSKVQKLRKLIEKRDADPVIQSQTLPPLVIRGWNFATAMTRWAREGFPMRSQDEIDERLAICQECPNLSENHCTLCGCACIEQNQVMNKLALKTEKCPIGKWD